MKKSSLLAILFSIALLSSAQKADLTVLKINRPEYKEGTLINITVKNTGNKLSDTVRLKVWDVDASLEEAKILGATEEQYWIFEENTRRAPEGEVDYDPYFEIFVKIPPLAPGAELSLDAFKKAIWVYNSNCEIGVFIDCDETLEENDEKNNIKYFFEGG